MQRGLGLVTGVHEVLLKNVLITDCPRAYSKIKKASGVTVLREFEGLPGFRVAIADVHLGGGKIRVTLVQAPPFPPAMFEVVNEVVLFGARRILAVTRGFRVKRSVPAQDAVVIGTAAIALDSVSPKIAPERLPLVADEVLSSVMAKALEDVGVKAARGYTLTVDSARLVAGEPVVQDYIKARQVFSVDTVSAPLYALRYVYPSLEPLSIVIPERPWSHAGESFEVDVSTYKKASDKTAELVAKIAEAYMGVVKSLGVP